MEVKGTTTDGAEVILTPKEVEHARELPDVALFIVSNVVVERSDDGTVTATGASRTSCGGPRRRWHSSRRAGGRTITGTC